MARELVIDADGIIAYANDAAHRLIGASGDELAGRTLWRLVVPSVNGGP